VAVRKLLQKSSPTRDGHLV